MKYRLFSRWICLLMLAFSVFNLVVWKVYTEEIMTVTRCAGGDLARLGYLPGAKMCRQNEDTLPKRHVEAADFTGGRVDVVTLGDSFSNGGGGGRDRYYQDRLASQNNFTVLNIPQFEDMDKITTLSILNNNGYLDRIKPRFILLECAEKLCLHDLPEKIDFERSITASDLKKHKTVNYSAVPQKDRSPLLNIDFFSEANLNFLRNSLLYNFSDHAYFSPVYKAKLSRPLFSTPDPDVLLFFSNDIKDRKKYTEANISRFNDYLNQLSDRLRLKGIMLYFMPCVDKYNLYSNYIIGNKYPESTFFEKLRALPKRYSFIDTKKILRNELESGVKDLYYADDTHWSWKAPKRVFEITPFP